MDLKRFNFHSRVKREFRRLKDRLQRLETMHDVLRQGREGLRQYCASFARVNAPHSFIAEQNIDTEHGFFGPNEKYFYVRRGDRLRILGVSAGARQPEWLASASPKQIVKAVTSGKVKTVEAARLAVDGSLGPWDPQPWLLMQIRAFPKRYKQILNWFDGTATANTTVPEEAGHFYQQATKALIENPALIDFVAHAQAMRLPKLARTKSGMPLPFDDPDMLPPLVPAEPKRRSVVFLHNCYYHFNQLAQGLKQRGWDAVTVSVESPDSPQRQFYIGEDINLYHDDRKVRRQQIRDFLKTVPERFGALHFYGQGLQSAFKESYESTVTPTMVPWDLLELRRHGMIIGYTPSGCLDGARQSAIRKISGDVCSRCVWELRPDVCSDQLNAAWAQKLDLICDWTGIEGDWAVDERTGPKYVLGPVVTALDPDYWGPALEVPEEMRIKREPNELLVYHAFGNADTRRGQGRDIKGTGAVEAAVAKLRSEGIPLKLFVATKVPIDQVRYYKVQADIVVDQLNYGRIGANARESFMLGRPVITRLVPEQTPLQPLRSVSEAPALDASEASIEAVLKGLALDPDRRAEMSRQSRDFALRWFSTEVCARRFEMVIDRVAQKLPPETDELYSPPPTVAA